VYYGGLVMGGVFRGAGWELVSEEADPDDCSGHGTHVAGIVDANGGLTGLVAGVSFGAYQVFDCTAGAPASRFRSSRAPTCRGSSSMGGSGRRRSRR
jgi:subtilisin family serine protease